MALLIIMSVAAVTSTAAGVAACRTAANDDRLEVRMILARRTQLAAARMSRLQAERCSPSKHVFLVDERDDDVLSIAIGEPASDPRHSPL